jgi:hypothetical protein
VADRHRINVWLTLAFVFFGYLGAANFYFYLIGPSAPLPLPCLACPNILSSGDALRKFIWRVAVGGTLNALIFLAVGWLLVLLVRIARGHSAKA